MNCHNAFRWICGTFLGAVPFQDTGEGGAHLNAFLYQKFPGCGRINNKGLIIHKTN